MVARHGDYLTADNHFVCARLLSQSSSIYHILSLQTFLTSSMEFQSMIKTTIVKNRLGNNWNGTVFRSRFHFLPLSMVWLEKTWHMTAVWFKFCEIFTNIQELRGTTMANEIDILMADSYHCTIELA